MDIKVKGGQVLSGEINPSGSKNSAVALIPATAMFEGEVVLDNIPDITDVGNVLDLMESMGSKVDWQKRKKRLVIDNSSLSPKKLKGERIKSMKGTSLLWGPLLARFKRVAFEDLPHGCTLGFRTLSPHYKAFKDLGVKVKETRDHVSMDARGAEAAEIWLIEMSPTATENAVMLACSLKGKTKIVGAASEPQVQDLCNFLVKCGAKIEGIGSNVLVVHGGRELKSKPHKLLSDHYEIATFLALGAATKGEVRVNNALPGLLIPIVNTFAKFGVEVKFEGDTAVVEKNQKIRIVSEEERGTLFVKAQPWPALPVDTLPLFIPLALAAKTGQVVFHNWMYEAGLFWMTELQKLGANIIINDPHRATVIAGNKLKGAQMEAPYIIRAVVAMVMTAMIAEGETEILNADALYRGHPDFSKNLKKLGADIQEVK
ncbi:MAG: UDP-N-acetylglucosamine 1-carboxyvinyltransferase [Candidatus Woesebacteria bacterium]|jgi:UDP-N-acetylglucosamine 1-carboxyvinyltransferase